VDITDESGSKILRFDGGILRTIKIDFRLELIVKSEESALSVIIETIFSVNTDGHEHVCRPDDAASLAPVLKLINDKVDYIRISPHGELSINFNAGESINVNPDPSYEAWQLNSANLLIVCPPEGGTVVF
jgi:hypothetical protein